MAQSKPITTNIGDLIRLLELSSGAAKSIKEKCGDDHQFQHSGIVDLLIFVCGHHPNAAKALEGFNLITNMDLVDRPHVDCK